MIHFVKLGDYSSVINSFNKPWKIENQTEDELDFVEGLIEWTSRLLIIRINDC